MRQGAPDLARLARRLSAHGLSLRSGFNFEPGEAAPATSVLLVGNIGGAFWPHFQAWLRAQPSGLTDPLDTWSRSIIGDAGASVGARAVSPSDKPFWPFQQWAMRAEGLKPSPLGILFHSEYGLWHAYRGALLFDHPLDLPKPTAMLHLCDLCGTKPCLHACPVGAHSTEGFTFDRCVTYFRNESLAGGASLHLGAGATGKSSGTTCRDGGCLDRNACPVGTAFRYPAAVQAFHMAAFTRFRPFQASISSTEAKP